MFPVVPRIFLEMNENQIFIIFRENLVYVWVKEGKYQNTYNEFHRRNDNANLNCGDFYRFFKSL